MTVNKLGDHQFSWTNFYMEFADKLLAYKDDRTELLTTLEEVYGQLRLNNPFTEEGELIDDICPFTIFGGFNKGITDKKRFNIATEIGTKIGVTAHVPEDFDGIPVVNNMSAWFFDYKNKRGEEDIQNLWDLYEVAIDYSKEKTEKLKKHFISLYDIVSNQRKVKWNITMGLYWIRPFTYLNLDGVNRTYLLENKDYLDMQEITNLKKLPDGNTYVALLYYFEHKFHETKVEEQSFPELSYASWIEPTIKPISEYKSNSEFLQWFSPVIETLKKLGGSATPKEVRDQISKDLSLSAEVLQETRGKTNVNKFMDDVGFARTYLVNSGYIDNSVHGLWTLTDKAYSVEMTHELASKILREAKKTDQIESEAGKESKTNIANKTQRKYWIYSPGRNASMWDEFYNDGVMGIVWGDLGNLKNYATKEDMKVKMKELYGEEFTYKNAGHATWQFANEVKPGDVVYAKKGQRLVIGYGYVTSDYIFDETREKYKHIHKVDWKVTGQFEHPGQAVNKALTDITPYTDYLRKLKDLFVEEVEDVEPEEIEDDREEDNEPYTEANFLNEVFMDEASYKRLVHLLQYKKNLILQGAPGVGKTFLAKRLAYSMMGEKDEKRVKMIQFHQSYSYEDFMMGFRPTETGFALTEGPFYSFCKEAELDSERDYFFIIDEINRGNLSQIFGELLMLLEGDKRGQELRLIYQDEQFSIPKNVYVIGMMNTADRSLAIIDYALRRRFSFYTLKPAFDSEGFQEMVEIAGNDNYNRLVSTVKALNKDIAEDESLGAGFQIGHSYLTTNEEVTNDWLSLVIEYEILPLLEEYWFDEPEKIQEWTSKLRGVIHDTN